MRLPNFISNRIAKNRAYGTYYGIAAGKIKRKLTCDAICDIEEKQIAIYNIR